MKFKKTIGGLLGAVAVLGSLTVCSPPWLYLPKEGQILEWPSKKPIEGAVVVSKWRGEGGIVDYRSSCYHIESAITDKDGRYTIPFYLSGLQFALRNGVFTTIYKAGYKRSTFPRKGGLPGMLTLRMNKKIGLYYLERDEQPASKELEHIADFMHSMNCGALQNRRGNFTVYKKLYNLARPLAITREDNMVLRSIRSMIVRVWRNSPYSISLEKSEKYFEKNLKDKFQ